MDYRKLIVESGLRMANSGLTVETWGNISARDPETGLVYLTPSAMQYDTITVDDVVVAELDGKIVQGTRKPTIETGMHLAVYRARKDVNAVIHTHPTYSMVYSCQGKDIPLFMDEAAQIMGDTCHTTPYALPGSQELADAVVAALGEKANTCLVRSHGAVAVGGDMDGAFRTYSLHDRGRRGQADPDLGREYCHHAGLRKEPLRAGKRLRHSKGALQTGFAVRLSLSKKYF